MITSTRMFPWRCRRSHFDDVVVIIRWAVTVDTSADRAKWVAWPTGPARHEASVC